MPKKNTALSLLFVFAIVLSLNLIYPFMSDDYVFRFVWHGEYSSMFATDPDYPQERIDDAGDVLRSLHSKYFTWGGRMITWTLAYIFANLPEIVFDLLNSLVFLIFLSLLTMMGTKTFSLRELNPRWPMIAFLLLWGSSAMFTDSYLWMSGSVGYLWPLTAQAAFLFVYVRRFWRTETEGFNGAFMFLLGMIAGWSNENTGAVTILAVALLLRRFWRGGGAIRPYVWGLVGACLGYGLLMAAPGNFARMASAAFTPDLLEDLPRQQQRITVALLFCVPLLAVFFFAPRLSNGETQKKSRRLAQYFLAAGIINTLMMFPLLYFPLRALTGSVMFWLIGALLVLSADERFCREGSLARLGRAYLFITLISLAAFMYTMAAYLAPQERAMITAAQKSTGADLTLPPYTGPIRLINIAALKGYRGDSGSIGKNTAAWPNRLFAAYWHLNSVVREKYFVPSE